MKCHKRLRGSVDKSVVVWAEILWTVLLMSAFTFLGPPSLGVVALVLLPFFAMMWIVTITVYSTITGTKLYGYCRGFDVLYLAGRTVTVFWWCRYGVEKEHVLLAFLELITSVYVALAHTSTDAIQEKLPGFLVGYALAAKKMISRESILTLLTWLDGEVVVEMDEHTGYSSEEGGAEDGIREVEETYPGLDAEEEAANGMPPLEDAELDPQEDTYAEEEEEAGDGVPPLQDTELKPQEDVYAEEEEEAGEDSTEGEEIEDESNYTEDESNFMEDESNFMEDESNYTEDESNFMEDESNYTEDEDEDEDGEEDEDNYYRELEEELEEMVALHDKEISQYQDEFNKLSMDHQKERAKWEIEKQTLLKVIVQQANRDDDCRASNYSSYKEHMKEYMELVREWRADLGSSSRLPFGRAYLGGRLQPVKEEVEKLKRLLEKSEDRRSALQAEKDDLARMLSQERVKCQAFERWMSQVVSG